MVNPMEVIPGKSKVQGICLAPRALDEQIPSVPDVGGERAKLHYPP